MFHSISAQRTFSSGVHRATTFHQLIHPKSTTGARPGRRMSFLTKRDSRLEMPRDLRHPEGHIILRSHMVVRIARLWPPRQIQPIVIQCQPLSTQLIEQPRFDLVIGAPRVEHQLISLQIHYNIETWSDLIPLWSLVPVLCHSRTGAARGGLTWIEMLIAAATNL